MKKFLSSTKGKIIAGAATLVVIAAVVVVVILLNTGYRSIRVEDLDGTTKISADSGVIEAFEGQNLKDGYKVRVLEDSFLTLALDSDKHVFADELTKFRIEAVGVAGKDSRTVIRLEKGSVLSRIDNKLLPSESYVVESPNASMSVRGTVFTVKVFYDDEGFCHTVVEVEEGVVEFSEKGTDNKEKKTLNEGDRAEVVSHVDEEDDEKPTESSANSSSDLSTPSGGGNTGSIGQAMIFGDFEYRARNQSEIAITKYLGNDEVVNVPAEIEGKKVVYVTGFYRTGVTSVTIPDGVKKIDDSAFAWCDKLTSIEIPDSVTEIGQRAFERCNFTSINIPDGVTVIKENTFTSCSALTSITIPDSVTKISSSAFTFCNSLTSLTIPDSVTEIGYNAFGACRGLKSVTLPEGITVIGEAVFGSCNALTSVTIPDSVTRIDKHAFAGCGGLTSITIPESVTEIGDYAFQGCEGLTSITIPNSVAVIGKSAFDDCFKLTDIEIPDSVTVIGENAFRGCRATITYKGNTYTSENYSELYTE